MKVDAWSNDNTEASERRLLITKALLSFKTLSWELRSKKSEDPFSNLSIYALLYLKNNEGALNSEIMNALKSNYNDVSNAIKILEGKHYVTSDLVTEGRFNNRIGVKSKRYRLTLHGDLFVSSFIEKLID